MFSKLRSTLCYKNLSPEIANHDQDIDADEWDYNGRVVYRGLVDPAYHNEGLSVYWLYDSDLKRVGLSEHEKDNEEKFEALWFRENDFSTLLQEEWKSLDKTIWSLLSPEAYQDCLEDEFENIIDRTLLSSVRLITPLFVEDIPTIYECEKCNKKSISEMKTCSTVKKTYITSNSLLFIDSNYILYVPPTNSSVWSKLKLPSPSYDDLPASHSEEAPPEELTPQLPETPQQELQAEPEHLPPDPPPQDSHP